jgi:uncharacterized protein YcfJ
MWSTRSRQFRPPVFRLCLEILEDRLCLSSLTLAPPLTPADAATQAQVSQAYGQLPLSFEANQGQADAGVDFLSRGSGYTLSLTPGAAVLALQKPDATAGTDVPGVAGDVLRMELVGGNAQALATGLDAQAGTSNYFIGNDPTQWHTGITNYGRVEYQNVYAGVNLVYYGNQRQLEYDFIVAPGANPNTIRLAFDGAERLSLDAVGNLVLHTASGGDVIEHAPVVYQELGGVRQDVAGNYRIGKDGQVGFQVGAYDPSRPLVIDPVLSYSTYLGGAGSTGFDTAFGIAVDQSGNAYVTGYTQSTSFPTTTGALQTGLRGGMDVFITELNATGTALVYSTYLGGSSSEYATAIAVDGAGNAYVEGNTTSTDFPTTAGAFERTLAQSYNATGWTAFVSKLNATGTALGYSTFLNNGLASGIAVDAAGSAYVAGAAGAQFPVTAGAAYQTGPGFATKLLPDGSGLVYSTRLGVGVSGGNPSPAYIHQGQPRIAVDAAGNAYVSGTSLTSTYQAWAMKFSADGSQRLYFTQLGGDDRGYDIAVDDAGNAYVLVQAYAYSTFPTTPGSYRPTKGNEDMMAVAKLSVDAAGQPFIPYGTFLGGGNPQGIAVDRNTGNAYVTGALYNPANATPGPTPDGDPSQSGQDVFVRGLSADGATLVYSTYLGGVGVDTWGNALAVDQTGDIYLAGGAGAPGFPTTPNAFQPKYANDGDAFVAKIAFPVPGIPVATVSGPGTSLARGQPGTFILGVTGASDPAAVYSFHINWGDGTSQTVNGPAGTAVNHIYTSCGTPGSTYVVQVTGTDQAGNPLQPSYRLAGVAPVVLEGTILAVGGTTGADKIYLTAADSTGQSVSVSINGTSWGTYQPGQIVVFGQGGNDTIQIKSATINKQTVYVTVPAVLFGGDGNNTLDASGSTANNILVGGAGSDRLTGGRGRDLLIGGGGSDTLTAGSGDDILIGGSTIWDLASPTMTFPQQLLALNAIMAEWGSGDSYATRVNYLQNGGGLNGSVVLNASTIVEDSTASDTLVGAASPALDWFLTDALANDVVKNTRSGEVITKI